MIEDRSPLKHSVHKVCVPNLHIAHFRKAQDEANPTVRRIFCLASSLRYCSPPQSKQAHRREAIMSRQETEDGTAVREYLTVNLQKWFDVTERRCMAGLRRAK
jgi:hypothetical protein